MEIISHRKYLLAFFATAAIFVIAILAANFYAQKRIGDISKIENRIALDILSSETQSALLEETSCKDIGKGFLSKSLGDLADRLYQAEQRGEFNNKEIEDLKRSYFLLEIKDYLLMKKVTEKCGFHPTFILYFYATDEADCKECMKAGYVLTALQEKYPDLRIYSFDYYLDLEAIKTLISIYNVQDNLPAMIINNDPYYGFSSLDELVKTVPALSRLRAEAEKSASTTATSTVR